MRKSAPKFLAGKKLVLRPLIVSALSNTTRAYQSTTKLRWRTFFPTYSVAEPPLFKAAPTPSLKTRSRPNTIYTYFELQLPYQTWWNINSLRGNSAYWFHSGVRTVIIISNRTIVTELEPPSRLQPTKKSVPKPKHGGSGFQCCGSRARTF